METSSILGSAESSDSAAVNYRGGEHSFHHSPPGNYDDKPSNQGSFSLTSILLIVIPIFILILLSFIVVLIILLRRQRRSSKCNNYNSNSNSDNSCKFAADTAISFTESSPEVKNECMSNPSSRRTSSQFRQKGVQVFTYKELEMATNNFNETNVIGHGGYGVVYRGILGDGTVTAIKMVNSNGKQEERAFRIEVDLLSRLQSLYLVELLGYCADQNHRLLIFEFMPNGSLQQHLHSPHTYPQPLDWGTRLRIALDCARALEFLHEHVTPSIIHRDFKCSNILLDHNFRAKVSDFGLAKTGSNKINGQISTRVLGTTGYLAPEYASTGKLTTKSDVYSFGVVLLQLITGRVPVDTRRPSGEHVLVDWALPRLTHRQKVMEMIDPNLKGQYSQKDIIQIAAIAAVCVQVEPDYRPLMTDVVQSLIPLVKNLSSVPSSSSRYLTNFVSPRSQRPSLS
ncbi:probable serine/threonine-protein kinase PBL7 isoform X1 [Chenopodium quinoa]|uniref:probable serine/threonine-protein kinase PBL7 isoform X1 n=1 Tax=Chenopodium quinoa TaxID=63459 RepID=UPI000B773F12|nr:probable serine/threonine-protein kinase PBL7 isoform X1 [Chenopodium quinoa]